jgi:predicted thioesterase
MLVLAATVKLVAVEAFDGVDTICRSRHECFVFNREKFDRKLAEKIELA